MAVADFFRVPKTAEELTEQITEAVFGSSDSGLLDRPGGVFIRRQELLTADDILMLRATARFIAGCDGQSLDRIVRTAKAAEPNELEETEPVAPPPRTSERSTLPFASVVQRFRAHASNVISPWTPAGPPGSRPDGEIREQGTADWARIPLLFDNGLGGLTPEGDYLIRVSGDRLPPAPWANVIANPLGGFLVSERGAGFTWAKNSYFYRLTPWHNDPVADPTSEVLYLRDEDTGELWSATPAPIPHKTPYLVRHGAGFSSFEHEHAGIATHLTLGERAATETADQSDAREPRRSPAPLFHPGGQLGLREPDHL